MSLAQTQLDGKLMGAWTQRQTNQQQKKTVGENNMHDKKN